MYTPLKPSFLLLGCFAILSMLASIQYYLVRNTYELTKDQYNVEIRNHANRILNNQPALEKRIIESFVDKINLDMIEKTDQRQFLNMIAYKLDSVTRAIDQSYKQTFTKNTRLGNVSYLSTYNELVIEIKGTRHVLISAQEKQSDSKVVTTSSKNNLLPVRTFQGSVDGKRLNIGNSNLERSSIKLSFKGTQYANVSGWNQELLKRMGGIFLLAVALLFAVSTMFYLMFQAILQQKKIAEIQTDFTNNITHELKTPLSSTSVILKSLLKKEVRNKFDLFDELLASLTRQHQRIQQIVDSVLESAMVRDLEFEKTEVDIMLYLKAYSEDLKLADHKLEALIDPKSQQINVHLPSLEKALNNLIDNAVKYSNKGTVVCLKAYPEGDYYVINVSDQGPGISSQHQDKIFGKFWRIPEQNTHTVKGLGLGLYISREVIEQMEGKLILTSSPGRGCTFTIKLPQNEC